MNKSAPGSPQATSKKNLQKPPVSLKPQGKSRFAPGSPPVRPENPTVDTLGSPGSRLGAQAPPTGANTTTPPGEPATCETCEEFIQTRRTALLPIVGRHVVQTGQRPARLVEKIKANYHRRGHPTAQYVITASDAKASPGALKALRRLGKSKKPMVVSDGR